MQNTVWALAVVVGLAALIFWAMGKKIKKMAAMCPRCRGEGCDACDHGKILVTMADGEIYTLKCTLCDYENGGRLVNKDLPLPAPDIGCVECGAPKSACYYKRVE